MSRQMLLRLSIGSLVLLATLVWSASAQAQPKLLDASPAPNMILLTSPQTVTLTFNRILIERGTTLQVMDANGVRVDRGDVRIDPANRFVLSVSLSSLIEGVYTVSYTAAALGESTRLVGSYQFTISPPPPRLALLTPVDGQAFESGTVTLIMQVEYVDFALYDNRIRIYVDGELRKELRSLNDELHGLTPGVHQIRVVLTRFQDEELPDTETVVHITVAQSDPESAGREAAARAEPLSGPHLTPLQWAGLTLLTLLLLGAGIWMGRENPS